jgi:uncharacterized protein
MSVVDLEVLSADACLDLLSEAPVGRIGVTVRALPVILPVNFALVDGAIVFRTGAGTSLGAAAANAVVAFEVDAYEADGSSGWSVLVQGKASEVSDPAELEVALAALVEPWGVGGEAERVVRIDTRFVSGRRFSRRQAADR